VNVETIKNFWLAVPPRSEQDYIAKYIDQHSTAIDSLVAKIHGGVDRLREFRAALISAAVMGKIDVREGGV
jgi:restriction endonuclease S subunit